MNKNTLFSHNFIIGNSNIKHLGSTIKLINLNLGDKIVLNKQLYKVVDKELNFIEDDKSITLEDNFFLEKI